jgi:hypothetical protein
MISTTWEVYEGCHGLRPDLDKKKKNWSQKRIGGRLTWHSIYLASTGSWVQTLVLLGGESLEAVYLDFSKCHKQVCPIVYKSSICLSSQTGHSSVLPDGSDCQDLLVSGRTPHVYFPVLVPSCCSYSTILPWLHFPSLVKQTVRSPTVLWWQ